MLCSKCASIDYDALISPHGYEHHSSYSDLVVAAASGCQCCVMIEDAERHFRSILRPESPGWTSSLDQDGIGTQITFKLEYGEIALVAAVCQINRRAWKGPRNAEGQRQRLAYLECALEIATMTGN